MLKNLKRSRIILKISHLNIKFPCEDHPTAFWNVTRKKKKTNKELECSCNCSLNTRSKISLVLPHLSVFSQEKDIKLLRSLLTATVSVIIDISGVASIFSRHNGVWLLMFSLPFAYFRISYYCFAVAEKK